MAGISDIPPLIRNVAQGISAIVTLLTKSFPQITGTAATATAGAAALPANPVGFISLTLPNGTQVKVPYYAP